MEEKLKVLIADDDRVFTSALAEYLELSGNYEIVGIASDGITAAEMVYDNFS